MPRLRLRRFVIAAVLATALAACAGLPPGAAFPRRASSALDTGVETRLGTRFSALSGQHGGRSAFHLLDAGVAGLLTRVQMIDAAERTVDVQYFIFRGDATGQLITAALARAAARGLRVRVLVDDADTVAGDEQLLGLARDASVEIRIFNPFAYRGHLRLLRGAEFLFNMRRLDYRMHNKLMIVDNAVALIGGRNIGNQYFQVDPASQFADDDVFAAGPVVQRLSVAFDDYWNSRLSIPAAALCNRLLLSPLAAPETIKRPDPGLMASLDSSAVDYPALLRSGEPYAGLVAGRLPLTWAQAQVVADSPYKKDVQNGRYRGRLMSRPVAAAMAGVKRELLMITPYFIPGKPEMRVLTDLLAKDVEVGILTNSLMSSPELFVHAGYSTFRRTLLDAGADLYELRSTLGNPRGSGQTSRISSFGTYSLHAKVFVFDRERIFIGSMNYDQRSKHLNTEIGVLIESPELATAAAARFALMTQPENAYALSLRGTGPAGRRNIVWDTVEDGRHRQYTLEPARSGWQRLQNRLLMRLPDDGEL